MTFEEIENVKKSNLTFCEVDGLEELLVDDGMFETYGLEDAKDVVLEFDCCGEEVTLSLKMLIKMKNGKLGITPDGDGARRRSKCLPEASGDTNDEDHCMHRGCNLR